MTLAKLDPMCHTWTQLGDLYPKTGGRLCHARKARPMKPSEMDDDQLTVEFLKLTAQHQTAEGATKRLVLRSRIDAVLDECNARALGHPR